MALVKYSAGIIHFTGSVGNLTFQAGRSSLNVRPRPYPVFKPNVRRTGVKTNMQTCMASYKAMTAAQLSSYSSIYGVSSYPVNYRSNKTMTLAQAILHFNLVRLNSGTTFLVTASGSPFSFPIPSAFTITSVATTFNFNLSVTNPVNCNCSIYLSAPYSISSQAYLYKPKFVKMLTTNAALLAVATEYVAIYGARPAVGQFVNAKIIFHGSTVPYCSPVRFLACSVTS